MGCIGAHHIGSRGLVKDEPVRSHIEGCLFSPLATACVTARQDLLKLLPDMQAGRDLVAVEHRAVRDAGKILVAASR
jgi:hypothetical protein